MLVIRNWNSNNMSNRRRPKENPKHSKRNRHNKQPQQLHVDWMLTELTEVYFEVRSKSEVFALVPKTSLIVL